MLVLVEPTFPTAYWTERSAGTIKEPTVIIIRKALKAQEYLLDLPWYSSSSETKRELKLVLCSGNKFVVSMASRMIVI